MIGKPSFRKQIRVFTPRVQTNTYVHTSKIVLITLPFYKKKPLLREKYACTCTNYQVLNARPLIVYQQNTHVRSCFGMVTLELQGLRVSEKKYSIMIKCYGVTG